MDSTFFAGTTGVVIVLFLLLTAILWFLLPFAVFGIKNRLDRALLQAAEANRRLAAIESAIRDPHAPVEIPKKEEPVYDC